MSAILRRETVSLVSIFYDCIFLLRFTQGGALVFRTMSKKVEYLGVTMAFNCRILRHGKKEVWIAVDVLQFKAQILLRQTHCMHSLHRQAAYKE